MPATDLSALLRERGLRVTGQRLAVLRAVTADPHATAEVVADAVRGELGAISLQAVYDALNALVDADLVRRIQPAGSAARFEARVRDNHHHLICRSCGRVVDVDCAIGAAPCLDPGDGHGFQIDEAGVLYWGRCPGCAASARGTAAGRRPARVAGSGIPGAPAAG